MRADHAGASSHGELAQTIASVRAPTSLRAYVEDQRRRHQPLRLRRRMTAASVVASVALSIAAAVTLFDFGPDAPTVVETAALAERPSSQATPRPSMADANLLDRRAQGVSYPNWQRGFGWRAVGARVDAVGDRRATTVLYAKGEKRIGYTIISGDPLPPPGGARTSVRKGIPFRYLQRGDRSIIIWERNGRSCVLSGRKVERGTLLALAGWTGVVSDYGA
jgi:hypothetical protein